MTSDSRRHQFVMPAAVAVLLLFGSACDATARTVTEAATLQVRTSIHDRKTPSPSPTPADAGPGRTPPADSKPSPKAKVASRLEDPAPRTMAASTPRAVSIPAIGVRSSLIQLGLNPDGTMEVPQDWNQAGWYKESPTPGELGPAAIAGHVDSKSGPAVFYRLRDLKRGDRINVERRDGTTAVFAVTTTEQYPKDDFPTSKVYGNLDHAGLRLITCSGDFDAETDHYRDNLVVYAKYVRARR